MDSEQEPQLPIPQDNWYEQEYTPWNPDNESLPPTPIIEALQQLTLEELAEDSSNSETESKPDTNYQHQVLMDM